MNCKLAVTVTVTYVSQLFNPIEEAQITVEYYLQQVDTHVFRPYLFDLLQ